MPKTIKETLRAYTTTLILLPLFSSLVVFYFFIINNIVNNAYETIDREINVLETAIELWIQYRLDDIQHLSASPALTSLNPTLIARSFDAFMAAHDDFTNIMFVNRSGETEVSRRNNLGINISPKDYLANKRWSNDTLTTMLKGKGPNKYILIIAHSVMSDRGEPSGFIVSAINVKKIFSVFPVSDQYSLQRPYLLSSSTHTPLQDIESDTPEAAPPPPGQDGTPTVYTNNSGVRVVGTSRLIRNGEWLLVREEPMSTILGDMHTILLTLAAASLASVVALAPFLLRFSASISKPLEAIATISNNILSGNYGDARKPLDTPQTPIEIATLHRNFCTIAGKISQYVQALETYTSTDPLTGLGNRSSLEEQGSRIVETCLRAESPCSCIVIDIDHFKRINDTYGHQTGDAALRKIGEVLMRNSRKSDFAARMGGEEFVIISANTCVERALILAERIRLDIEQTPVAHEGNTFSMTASIGVAPMTTVCRFGTTQLEDLIGKADCALYTAKHHGRNRVEVWQDDEAEVQSCKQHL